LAAASLMNCLPSPDVQPGADDLDDVSQNRFLTSTRQDSCHRRDSVNPMNRHRFLASRAKAFHFSASFKGTGA
jgi:hypothetical protein